MTNTSSCYTVRATGFFDHGRACLQAQNPVSLTRSQWRGLVVGNREISDPHAPAKGFQGIGVFQ